MYSIRGIYLIDDPNYSYKNPVYTQPIVRQRYHGIIPYDTTYQYRGRFIHNYEHGNYTAGRHWSPNKFMIYVSSAFVIKIFYSSWNDNMRERKLQIGPTFLKQSIQHGLGIYHVTIPEQLEKTYLQYAKLTQDLRLIPGYQQLFKAEKHHD